MEFTSEIHKCTFTIPDRPTVREQLAYFSGASGSDFLFRLWSGAKAIITKWECDLLPDKETKLETLFDPSVTQMLIWVGLKVSEHMGALEDIPKN